MSMAEKILINFLKEQIAQAFAAMKIVSLASQSIQVQLFHRLASRRTPLIFIKVTILLFVEIIRKLLLLNNQISLTGA
jgi:hypothetical protein